MKKIALYGLAILLAFGLVSIFDTASAQDGPGALYMPVVVRGQSELISSGTVLLEGRSDHSGVIVSSSNQQVLTSADGSFSLDGPVVGPITASFPGYLSAVRTESGSFPEVTLLGGDVSGDQRIDIVDLAYIGRSFNSANFQADINGDGLVDQGDLALAGGNAGRIGPVDW